MPTCSLLHSGTGCAKINTDAGVVQWQNSSFPSWPRGFDSRRPLHINLAIAGFFIANVEVISLNDKNIVHDLFCKMKDNPDLVGSFEEVDGRIVWHLFEGYEIEIASEYIDIHKLIFGKIVEPIHHWHPVVEDLYDEACRLGTKGNVTVIHLFGPGSVFGASVVYSGPKDECPIKRKWLFGRYIYLFAE